MNCDIKTRKKFKTKINNNKNMHKSKTIEKVFILDKDKKGSSGFVDTNKNYKKKKRKKMKNVYFSKRTIIALFLIQALFLIPLIIQTKCQHPYSSKNDSYNKISENSSSLSRTNYENNKYNNFTNNFFNVQKERAKENVPTNKYQILSQHEKFDNKTSKQKNNSYTKKNNTSKEEEDEDEDYTCTQDIKNINNLISNASKRDAKLFIDKCDNKNTSLTEGNYQIKSNQIKLYHIITDFIFTFSVRVFSFLSFG